MPFFLIHQPVIIIALFVVQWEASIMVKPPLVVLGSFVITLGLGPGLWLHTGDIARIDPDGYFQIVDRKKHMIICGGFNVYPRHVEEVLYMHRAVEQAGVVGLPDEYRGETVKAFVVLRARMAATEGEIITFCGEHLAKYKVPASVELRKELPLSILGKVLRPELISS